MILNALKSFIAIFGTRNYTELPQGIERGLEKYLNNGEKILFTLLDFRAIYKAPTFIESNTFFNSWFVLTNNRIIIARNSSGFKRFRDIPLSTITQIHYELDNTDPKITINSPGNEDTIEFPIQTLEHCAKLEKSLRDAIENARNYEKHPADSDFIFCPECGSRTLRTGHFCSECGSRLKTN